MTWGGPPRPPPPPPLPGAPGARGAPPPPPFRFFSPSGFFWAGFPFARFVCLFVRGPRPARRRVTRPPLGGARRAARPPARGDRAVDRSVLLRGRRAGDRRVHARLRPRALGTLDPPVLERPRDARPLEGERGSAGGGGRRPAGHREPTPVHGLSPGAALLLPQGQPPPARHARRAAVAVLRRRG